MADITWSLHRGFIAVTTPFRLVVIMIAIMVTGAAAPLSVPTTAANEEEIDSADEEQEEAPSERVTVFPGLFLAAKQIHEYQKLKGQSLRDFVKEPQNILRESLMEFARDDLKVERRPQDEEQGMHETNLPEETTPIRLRPYKRRDKNDGPDLEI